jgi:diguanylate cyclase (GGDEF)-like protein
MHYGTFFFTNIASVTVFTVCIGLLSLYMRKIVGLRWFAGALVVGLAKLVLQGLEGYAPTVLTGMVANELYLVSFVMQYLGLRWFVVRTPAPGRLVWGATGGILAVYTLFYLLKVPYTGNIVNIPFLAVCGVSARMLLRRGNEAFRMLSRFAAAILCADICVASYRAILTNLHYMRPWETVNAHSDPRWTYSLAAMAFLATFMVMCYLWFLVTELGRELAVQARTDPLTGVLNRRAMEEAALREISRSVRHGHPLCMIMIDIDNFKRLNDTRGHAAGDRALQAMTAEIKSMLRASDLFARTGGEEFAILLPDTAAPACLVTAERLRRAIEDLEIPFESGPIRMTISAGVTQLGKSLNGWEAMMRRADEAMYAAKQQGRNQVSAIFNPQETIDSPDPVQ